jgi:hypothetical protein
MDPRDRIAELTERQRAILRGRCAGRSLRAIALDINESYDTVRRDAGLIWVKLRLDKASQVKRYKDLFERYCPALEQQDLPPPAPEPEVPEEVSEEVERMVEAEETDLALWGPSNLPAPIGGGAIGPAVRIGTQGKNGNRAWWRFLVLGVGVLLIGVIGGFVARLFQPPVPAPTVAITMIMPTQHVETVVTQAVLDATPTVVTTPAPPTPAPTQTPIERTVVVVATATPGPAAATQTPIVETVIVVATPTPVPPTPTSEPNILFFDDFEDGLDPAWEVVSGEVIVVNGRLTATEGGATLMVGDPSWSDYVIQCESWSDSAYPSNFIRVRVQDMDNHIYFRWRGFDSNWAIVLEGNAQAVPNSKSGNIGTGHPVIRVVVTGNEYRAYISEKRFSSFIDDRFPSGRVAISLYGSYGGAQIDNFSVTLLEQ